MVEPEPVPEIVLEDALRPKQPKQADIPDSVKPRPEEAMPPVLASAAQVMREKDMIARVCGYFGAFLVFLALFLLLVVFKGPIARAFPPSVMLYELIKLAPPVPGSGLVIDQLHAQVKDGVLAVDGRVINLTTADVAIPPLALFILDKEGAVLATHPVTIDDKTLKGESDIAISASIAAPPETGVSLKAGFTLP